MRNLRHQSLHCGSIERKGGSAFSYVLNETSRFLPVAILKIFSLMLKYLQEWLEIAKISSESLTINPWV